MAVYKPAKRRRGADYKHRKIKRNATNNELRLFTCFYSTSNLPTIINMIEASRGSDKREDLCVYAMHLMELSERSSTILMVHKARKNGLPFWSKGQSNQMIVAFEAYRQLCRVHLRPMIAISSMSNIHKDICSSAERKRAAMIILPFHKHQRIDGGLEVTRMDSREVNLKVLENAPCSVGILVDRGFGGTTQVTSSSVSSIVTVLFFGGPDDREALAYGVRMSEHPGISVVVIRLLLESHIISKDKPDSTDDEILLQVKKTTNDKSIRYKEKVVSNAKDVIGVVRDHSCSNLLLVGREPKGQVPEGLMRMTMDCPELGPMGNLLTSQQFSISASVMIVQQYRDNPAATLQKLNCTMEILNVTSL